MSAPVVVNQPGVYLVDEDGNTVTLSDAGTIGTAEGIVIMGKDGTVARMMVVDATGKLAIQNQPNMDVALSTLASETKLEAVRVLLAAIDADTSIIAAVDFATQTTLATLATEAKLEAVRVILASIKDTDGIKKITDALPTGANVIGKTVTRSGAKGTSVAADITSTPFDADTEALHVDIRDSDLSRLSAKLVTAGFHGASISGTTHILMIDLDDGGGDYKHTGSSSIKLTQISGSLVKSSIGAQWRTIIGVVVAINGTESTIHWLDGATLFALDTSTVEQHKAAVLPSVLDLEVTAGAIVRAAGGFIETGVTAVNTGATLSNVVGVAKTPAVGDMILRITQDSGGGTAEVAYSVRYLVD